MKILLVGAQGKMDQKLINELINNNDAVITTLTGDASDFDNLKTQAIGQDILVSTVGAHSVNELVLIAKNMITIARDNHQQIVWSGGAGSLWTNENTRLIDIPINDFPVELATWKPSVYGHYEVLKLLQSSNVRWSYLSPALDFEDILPRGLYKTKSVDNAIYNLSGDSFANYIIGAKALANEIMKPQYLHQRFTIVENY